MAAGSVSVAAARADLRLHVVGERGDVLVGEAVEHRVGEREHDVLGREAHESLFGREAHESLFGREAHESLFGRESVEHESYEVFVSLEVGCCAGAHRVAP